MGSPKDEEKDAYLDALVQMEILAVTKRRGEDWVSFRRPPSELLGKAIELGLLQEQEESENPLASIAGAIGMAILHERGIPFTKADLMGVASVLNGVFYSFFEEKLPEMLSGSSEAMYARSRSRPKGKN